MVRNDNKLWIAKILLWCCMWHFQYSAWNSVKDSAFPRKTPQHFFLSITPKGFGIYFQAMETIMKICYSRDHKFECALALLLRAKPYANVKYMSHSVPLQWKRLTTTWAASVRVRPACGGKQSCFGPLATLPQKVESRNRTKQLCHCTFQVSSRWGSQNGWGLKGSLETI